MPGLDTWPSLDAARHGGGHTWMPGAYDPETDLYIFGTGNPSPAYTGVARPGDNLFTCTLMAVKVSTGKMVWYYQTSPHDTHDWDSAQPPILFDAVINGKPRKLVSTAARNGYFFTLDRVTGEHLVTTQFGQHRQLGQGPAQDRPARTRSGEGRADRRHAGLAHRRRRDELTRRPPSTRTSACSMSPRATASTSCISRIRTRAARWAWAASAARCSATTTPRCRPSMRRPASPRGATSGRRPLGLGGGLLNTKTGVLFTGDGNSNFVALDSSNGEPLWHTRIGNISNAPRDLRDRRQAVRAGGRGRYAVLPSCSTEGS